MAAVSGDIEITYPVFRRMVLSFLGVRVVLLRVFGVLVLVLALFGSLKGDTGGSFILPFVFGLLIVGAPELAVWISWLVRRDQVAGPNHFTVSTTAVELHRRSGDTRVEWTDVTRVRRGRYAWSVTRTGFRALMIPRAAFSADDQRRVNNFFLNHPEFAG